MVDSGYLECVVPFLPVLLADMAELNQFLMMDGSLSEILRASYGVGVEDGDTDVVLAEQSIRVVGIERRIVVASTFRARQQASRTAIVVARYDDEMPI
jgi:hypothetical protein